MSVRVRPKFIYDVWGPYSIPLILCVEAVQLKARAIGRTTVEVEWSSVALREGDAALPSATRSRILIYMKGAATDIAAEAPIGATSYLFTQLQERTTYHLHAVAVYEAAATPSPLPAECPQVSSLTVTTTHPVEATIEHIGEDFVLLRWRRVASKSSSTASSKLHNALEAQKLLSGGRSSPQPNTNASITSNCDASNLSFTQQSNSTKPEGGTAESYAIVLRDEEFGEETTHFATPSSGSRAQYQTKRVEGLLAGCSYSVSMRVLLTQGGKFDAPSQPLHFRTLATLQIAATAATPTSVVIHCDRGGCDTTTREQSGAEFRSTVRISVEELPQMPHVSPTIRLSAVVRRTKSLYHSRVTAAGTPCSVPFEGLPPATNFCAVAQQRLHDNVWSCEVSTRFRTPKAAASELTLPNESPSSTTTLKREVAVAINDSATVQQKE